MKDMRRWDIFCAVVDNYGDIGVCWRLARQLANEHGLAVRLWVDDLRPLSRLCPAADPSQALQHIDGVEVRHWSSPFPATNAADVVIEAFGCALPESTLNAMAARAQKPVWINLEYLSAEPWVEGCHGMASPHPRLPLSKHFFFPGFTPATGGLLREGDYDQRRANFDPATFRTRLGLPTAQNGELTLSLFAYENPALPGVLEAWAKGREPVHCLVPEGRSLANVSQFFGVSASQSGDRFERGNLNVHVLPFLPQRDYDALLWLCDLNFVRGEDSFVRAQWAEKPLVWQIYPQVDAVHRLKLDAWLDHYLAALPHAAANATKNFWHAWNGDGDPAEHWSAFRAALPSLQNLARPWAQKIALGGDLADRLLNFDTHHTV